MGNSDSKANFREQVEKLLNESVSFDDEDYWANLLVPNLSLEDIFEMISPNDVRKLRKEKQDNAVALFRRLIRCLRNTCLWARSAEDPPTETLAVTSTVLRMLTRLIPFMFEEKGDEFSNSLFWGPFVFDSDLPPEMAEVAEAEGQVGRQSLAAQLLHYLMRLLFLKKFSVNAPGVVLAAKEPLPQHKVDTRFVWQGGIGTAAEAPNSSTKQMLKNRTEVLRCLVVCLSGPLFQTIDEYQSSVPLWLRVFTDGKLPYTANLFCSLTSLVAAYPVQGSMLPFSSPVMASPEGQETVDVTLQLLCILMDFNPEIHTNDPIAAGGGESGEAGGSQDSGRLSHSGGGAARNVYRKMLSGVKKDAEIDLLFDAFVRLLNTVWQGRTGIVYGSVKSIPFHQELLTFLWHVLTINQSFLKRMTSGLPCNRLLVSLLFILLDADLNKDVAMRGPSKVGLLHMCSFILLVLSSEREFAVGLNEPFSEKLPIELPPFQGCHADLLVIVVHRVIVDASKGVVNNSLIDMLLTVLCNISAYVKSFCLESCLKILSLLDRFSKPAWVFRAPCHYHDIFFLLDTFNNIIQYQYEGNQQMVYSILRQKHLFQSLLKPFPEKVVAQVVKRARGEVAGESAAVLSDSAAGESPTASAATAADSRTPAATPAADAAPPSANGDAAAPADSPVPPEAQSTVSSNVPVQAAGGEGEQHPPQQNGGEKRIVKPADTSGVTAPGSAAAQEDQARGGGGEDVWVPSESWYKEWQEKLPLQTVTRLVECLLPRVERECHEKSMTNQSEVVGFLQRTTMVGLLPVPHPIIIRNYQPNAYTALWFTSFMWGVIFARSQSLALYDWRRVRLIVINNV
uniref:Dymeclin n=1 Tax=Chromera velia CCMP2878 TaxID=1169474 RepID=A0A0G4HK78_9ALVE|eukprot:Cvel_7181.t1-p1 / transcript=Cvel_7181.t1 / gene=Cvel_7181 / organism=Chromera_velia_CCMP2878 / gene_product=Protein HID1, putative / transcript_product=Protein HID1, putative / location=Cvel_scaffold369:59292-71603(+) / protein_length=849 / sequence_SO=supercontig / SO=protein_coding / is_pseudo=false